jgi:hypothetical protein
MFSGTPITSLDIDFTSWTSSGWGNTLDWMVGVPAAGTFYKPSILPENKGSRYDIRANALKIEQINQIIQTPRCFEAFTA